MRQFIAKSLVGTVFAGGMLISGAGVAAADSGSDAGSVNNGTVLSGNNVNVPINIPITACGNGLALLSVVNSACVTDGKNGESADASAWSFNQGSVGSGNNINLPINAPITLCGNGVAALSVVNSACVEDNHKPVLVPSGCVHDCLPVHEPCRDDCRPVAVVEPCRQDYCGPISQSRPVSAPGKPHDNKPVPTVNVATTRSVKDGSGSIAHTGLTALAAVPIGVAFLLAGAVFYRRSRVRPQT